MSHNALLIPGTKRPLRAVLFDIDGTLYHQPLLRCLMALELCTLPWGQWSWQCSSSTLRVLRTFRRVREELRGIGESKEVLEALQYQAVVRRLEGKVGEEAVRQIVQEWLLRRPLKYLSWCRYRGIKAFLTFLADCKIPMGVFSDYPVHEKLQALELTNFFSVRLCATDPAINAFKPHPKGFQYACELLGIYAPEDVLYIGDRPEIDATGAIGASMACAILATRATKAVCQKDYLTFSSFRELHYVFLSNH